MRTNPLTQSKKIREMYNLAKGELFVLNTQTGYFNHPQLDVDQSVMQWLMNEGWVKVHPIDPSKNIWHNLYEVL